MKIHSKTFKILDKTMNLVQPITFQRAARQFGTYLNKQTDLMRSFHVEYLIPLYTKSIVGKNEIYQTIRFINKGLTPDEIIGNKLIQLPPRLKQNPYLQEFYVFIGVYMQYLDWFSGKTSTLNLDSPKT
ncbi:unnamed protein product [Adineta steineri]|uniref:Uncharacterized protein n=1 Tax=Adineta steineri TaxID=433720 RepID=A0A815GGK5_9BILA|nr:unnamed protein product [Adineta steineri]CAF1339430.1 unnamed protein product [Adineta steineri]CAF1348270.1 unnamed protein product [Adineta steineri]